LFIDDRDAEWLLTDMGETQTISDLDIASSMVGLRVTQSDGGPDVYTVDHAELLGARREEKKAGTNSIDVQQLILNSLARTICLTVGV
jgi:hypothetical protein